MPVHEAGRAESCRWAGCLGPRHGRRYDVPGRPRSPSHSLPKPQTCGRAGVRAGETPATAPLHGQGQGTIPRSHRGRCLSRNACSPPQLVLTCSRWLSVPKAQSRPLPTELVPHAGSPANPASPLVGAACRRGPLVPSLVIPHTERVPCAQYSPAPRTAGPVLAPAMTHTGWAPHTLSSPTQSQVPHVQRMPHVHPSQA